MTFCSYNPYQVLSLDPQLSTLKYLVDLAGLKSNIENLCNSTLFAPVNAAFAAKAGLTEYLAQPENKTLLKNVLLYHITGKPLTTLELVPTRVLDMLDGRTTVIYAALYLNFVPVIQDKIQENYDVIEGNIATKCSSYIQKINGVMQPEPIYYPKILNPPNSVWNAEQL